MPCESTLDHFPVDPSLAKIALPQGPSTTARFQPLILKMLTVSSEKHRESDWEILEPVGDRLNGVVVGSGEDHIFLE